MGAKGVIGCLVVVGLIAGACSGGDDEPIQATRATTASAPARSAPVVMPIEPPAPITPTLMVKRVIDGDTFELTDGARVRVLGINSCEMGTKGGQEAKEYAEYWLLGSDVTLRAEPTAPDKDRYGRLLRYVTAKGADLGVSMIYQEHTSVYQGKNDASPDYVAELRGKDDGPLYCAGVAAYVSRDDNYVPTPNNDDNGESRFCRKRRWC